MTWGSTWQPARPSSEVIKMQAFAWPEKQVEWPFGSYKRPACLRQKKENEERAQQALWLLWQMYRGWQMTQRLLLAQYVSPRLLSGSHQYILQNFVVAIAAHPWGVLFKILPLFELCFLSAWPAMCSALRSIKKSPTCCICNTKTRFLLQAHKVVHRLCCNLV